MCVDDVDQTEGGGLESVQIFILAEGLKIEFVLALSSGESSLVQTFWNPVYALTSPIHPFTWLRDL